LRSLPGRHLDASSVKDEASSRAAKVSWSRLTLRLSLATQGSMHGHAGTQTPNSAAAGKHAESLSRTRLRATAGRWAASHWHGRSALAIGQRDCRQPPGSSLRSAGSVSASKPSTTAAV